MTFTKFQYFLLGVTFDAVISAEGDDDTCAGLTLGAKLFLPGTRPVGIGVCDDPFAEIAMELTAGAAELLETDVRSQGCLGNL